MSDSTINGMADIIPPAPAHDGLAALLAPTAAATGWLFALLIVLALLLSAWLMRRHLLTRLRLAQAKRSLCAGRVEVVEKLLRKHFALAQLHPAKPPVDVNATCWRALVEALHELRFGMNAITSPTLTCLLNAVFTPSPLTGEGRGEGGDAGTACSACPGQTPYPTTWEGANRPHGQDGVRP